MAAAALILGIMTLIFSFIPGLNFIAPALGVTGIALGALARKRLLKQGRPADIATGGLITSIIGTVFSLLFYIACAACLGGSGLMMDRMMREMHNQGVDIQRIEEQMRRSMEKAIDEGRRQEPTTPPAEEKPAVKPGQI